MPERYYVLDFETTRWDPNLPDKSELKFLFGYIIEFEPYSFNILSEMDLKDIPVEKLLGSNKNKNVFYIHNLKFDFLFILEAFVRKRQKNIRIDHKISSTIIQIEVLKKYQKGWCCVADFRNTFCLWSTSLETIGKNIGTEKIKHNKFFGINESEDIKYCRQDCVVVLEFLRFWYEKINDLYKMDNKESPEFKKITLTASSTAKRIFQDFSDGYVVLNDFKSFDDQFRPYYFGARTEVFNFNACENAKYYDFNSLYLSVLIQNRFPIFPIWISQQRTDSSFAIICNVDESNCEIPLIPERIDLKTMFRACKKSNVLLQIEEYEYLKSRNVPIEEIKWVNTAKLVEMFRYLQYIYDLRLQMKAVKNPFEQVLKLIGNSSYGFFGTRKNRDTLNLEFLEEVNEEILQKLKTEENLELDFIDGQAILREHGTKEVENLKINVLIAGRITALARLKITKLIHELRDNGIIVYYCDTDSVVCQENDIIKKYLDNKGLGLLKIEKEGWFLGFAPKFYVMISNSEYDFKLKGVPLKIQDKDKKTRLEIIEELRKIILQYKEQGIELVGPASIKKMIQNNYTPCQVKVIKKQQSYYMKRKINSDKSTSPLSDSDKFDNIEEMNKEYIEDNFEILKKKVFI